jgi:predicted transcriptional regulator
MRQDSSFVKPNETVFDAAKCMARSATPAIPVKENGRVVGVLTDRDISQKVVALGLDPGTTLVASIMNGDPVRISDDRDLDTVILVMRARGVQELIVQDFTGNYLGIVCNCDLCSCPLENE